MDKETKEKQVKESKKKLEQSAGKEYLPTGPMGFSSRHKTPTRFKGKVYHPAVLIRKPDITGI